MSPTLRSIRRYPVKSMGGESLTDVAVDTRGLVGDRWFAVEDAEGHFASGKSTRRFRRRDAVFDYAARTAGDIVEVVGADGAWRVGDRALDDELSRRMGVEVAVRPEADVSHQDDGQVSLIGTATLAWCARQWGIEADPRRLRVNLVIETEEPFVEEGWVGEEIRIGEVVLRGVQRIERCRMVDVAQDGASNDGAWLKPLARERDTRVAVYADVVAPGTLRVGDGVVVG